MTKYLGPKCKLCRREGVKLFLKGERCDSPACPIEKKGAVPPGQHGQKRMRGRQSEYGEQLREKQKARRIYGVSDRQLRRYFKKAKKEKTATGKTLLVLLESRLDNVIFRLGFATSRSAARQLIKHGHVQVNNQKVDIPSFLVKKDDVICLTKEALEVPEVKKVVERKDFKVLGWLERKARVGRVKHLPKEEELPQDIEDQLIVEFYSRA